MDTATSDNAAPPTLPAQSAPRDRPAAAVQPELPFEYISLVTTLPDGGYRVAPKRVERAEWIPVSKAAGILGLSERQVLNYYYADMIEGRQVVARGKVRLLRRSVEKFAEGKDSRKSPRSEKA